MQQRHLPVIVQQQQPLALQRGGKVLATRRLSPYVQKEVRATCSHVLSAFFYLSVQMVISDGICTPNPGCDVTAGFTCECNTAYEGDQCELVKEIASIPQLNENARYCYGVDISRMVWFNQIRI